MRASSKGLVRFCQVGYFIVGTIVIIFPPLMPNIIAHFGLSLASAGLAFPAKALGSFIGSMFSGVSSDLLGRKPLLVTSALLQAAGLGLAALAGSWPVFLLGFAIMGASQGAVSTTINALMSDLHQENRAKALNLLHGIYSTGAALSPLLIALVLGLGRDWRVIFAGSALVWLAFGLAALLFNYPKKGATVAKRQLLSVEFLKNSVALSLFAVAFIYNGVAWVLLGWVNMYLQESGGVPAFLATSMISLFYVGLTLGRFVCASVADRVGYAKTILILSIGAVVSFPLVILGRHPLVITFSVALSGLFFSGLYPTALAYANNLFPALAGTVAATMSLAMTLGTMIPPWWTGIIADRWSFKVAVGMNYLLILPLLWIAWRLLRVEKGRQ
ncbi:MAG: MFS transporter [Limnochordia bacterium]|jgi:fucose permease